MQVDRASAARCGVDWHPDGGALLAVAGSADGDVALYERLSWEASSYLGGGHRGPANVVAFSPNGKKVVVLVLVLVLVVISDLNSFGVWCLDGARLLGGGRRGPAKVASPNVLVCVIVYVPECVYIDVCMCLRTYVCVLECEVVRARCARVRVRPCVCLCRRASACVCVTCLAWCVCKFISCFCKDVYICLHPLHVIYLQVCMQQLAVRMPACACGLWPKPFQ
jgi:hypothetical protein